MLCRWVPGHSPALHSALLSLLLALLSTEERLWRLQVWSEQRLVSNHPSYLLYRHPTHFIHTSYTFIQTSCTFCTHILHLYIDILQFLGRGATSIRRFWVYASSFHLTLDNLLESDWSNVDILASDWFWRNNKRLRVFVQSSVQYMCSGQVTMKLIVQ